MSVTKQQFNTLEDLFSFYNDTLFGSELAGCLVNLSRHRGAYGFFAPNRWKDREDGIVHEISINPDHINRPDREWHSTLVHEMVHLWQQDFGKPPRRCYHDKQFAAKMEAVGLMPSNTGQPGGKKTGGSMTHYVIDGGPFDLAFGSIEGENLERLKLPYIPSSPKIAAKVVGVGIEGGSDFDGEGAGEQKKSASGVKMKYFCSCGQNAWGKPGLKMQCMVCNEPFEEAD